MVLSPLLLFCAYDGPKSLLNNIDRNLLDGHPVIHALHAVYIFDIFFSGVFLALPLNVTDVL